MKARNAGVKWPGFWARLLATFILTLGFAHSASSAEEAIYFDVNLVVLTDRPEALAVATAAQMRREVEILNTYFHGANGERPVYFNFKAAYFPSDLADTSCSSLLALGDAPKAYDSTVFKNLFYSCNDVRMVDPRAINFYVYDSYTASDGFADRTSHGHNNGDRPFIVLDWVRLDHQVQSPEEHEMGHAFGLDHVCVPGATINSSTNIMASTENCNGSGGQRNIGFDPGQLDTVRQQAEDIRARVGVSQAVPAQIGDPAQIPTLNGWGRVLLSLLLASGALLIAPIRRNGNRGGPG